jgi:hypothetical protein
MWRSPIPSKVPASLVYAEIVSVVRWREPNV